MDALDLLEQQHRDLRDRLACLAAAPDLCGREAELLEALRAVEAHVRTEETYLYAVHAARMTDEQRLQSALAEHAFLRAAARELASARQDGPLFSARLMALSERFAAHADEEEDWAFPKLKRSMTDEELDALGTDLELAFDFFKETGWAPVRSVRQLPRMSAGVRGQKRVQRTAPRASQRMKGGRVRGSASA
jgi:Hemerythrin HHE cation binding domain